MLSDCDVPVAPPNGQVILSDTKLSLNYHCDSGYTISGSSGRVCSSDGTGWTGSQPSCGMISLLLLIV